jgi:soluble lytic murein transglycosylase-like protein
MSILSDAFDGVVDFFSNLGSSPSNNLGQNDTGLMGPPEPGSMPGAQPASTYGLGDGVKDILSIAAPLIATSVTRPKPLPLPEQPKFPEIPDSVKNDPRVQQLLGSYGFPNSFPTIAQQDLSKGRPSDFQVAFPAMFNAALGIFGREVDKTNAQAEQERTLLQTAQQKIDAAKGVTATSQTTPQQVAQTTVIQADGQMSSTSLMSQTVNGSPKASYDAIKTTSKYDPLIENAAKQHGIDPDILRAVIHTESEGNSDAIGDGGKAVGLGQLHKAAAQDAGGRYYSDEELKVPETNIDLTARYLKQLHTQFNGNSGDPDYSKAITAFNRGATAVKEQGAYDSPKGKAYRATVLGALAVLKGGKNRGSPIA